MERKSTNLWNTFKSIFATEGDNKEFKKELAELEKVQKQIHEEKELAELKKVQKQIIHEEKEKFGASLRAYNTSAKAKKGKGIQTQTKVQEKEGIERGE